MVVTVYPDTREATKWPPANFNVNTFFSTALQAKINEAIATFNNNAVTVSPSVVNTITPPAVPITKKFTAEYSIKVSAFTQPLTSDIKSLLAAKTHQIMATYGAVAMDDVSVAGMFKPTSST